MSFFIFDIHKSSKKFLKSDYIEIVILKNKMLNQAQQLQILAKRNPESEDQQAPSKSSSFGNISPILADLDY